MYKFINMEDRFLILSGWVFVLISVSTFNVVALLLSAIASITVIIRNRFELLNFYSEVKNKIKEICGKK